jgi:hypothetical protein
VQAAGHALGRARTVVGQHANQAQPLRPLGAQVLLEPGQGARHEEGGLAEGQDLAERVVAAHRHHGGGAVEQRLDMRLEGDGAQPGLQGHALLEGEPLLGGHERAQEQDGVVREAGVALVGREHPVDQLGPVAAATGGHQDERPARQLVLGRDAGVRRHAPPQVAGEPGLGRERRHARDLAQRVEDRRQAVDPDLVEQELQRREHPLALPLLEQARGLVHDVAQAEHAARAAGAEQLERRAHLAAQPQRLLVDQEQVRGEHLGGVVDDRAADLEGLVDAQAQVERGVLAVPELDHPRHADEVDARLEVEGADDRRAGKDQHRELGEAVDQVVRDRPAAAQVPEPEAVVAVDQQAGAAFHP